MTDESAAPGRAQRWRLTVVAAAGRWLPRTLPVLGCVLVALVGAGIGAALAPSTTATVGPLRTDVRVVPSLRPGVHLLLPPAGEVTFATHRAPVSVEARISRVDLEGARDLLSSPRRLTALERTGPDALRRATLQAAVTTALGALLGAVGLSLAVYRRVWRRTGEVALGVTAGLVMVAGSVALSFDPDELAQPQFTGLLSKAPYVANEAPGLLARLESYRSGISDIVTSVATLYATSGDLPALPKEASGDVATVLHVSDIHLNPLAFDLTDRLVRQFSVDVVVDTGDITTWGTQVESRVISRVGDVDVPYVFVRGNHDSRLTQAAVAGNRNAVVLDGDVKVVAGLVMAGVGDPLFTPDPGDGPVAPATPPPATPSATGTPPPAPSPQPTPDGVVPEGASQRQDPQTRTHAQLADAVRRWDTAHPAQPVQIALVHEPVGLGPLLGRTPVLLAGHTHQRKVTTTDGTTVMVQGSTGGAGITSSGLRRLTDGKPLPLVASLVYVARTGPRAGQVIAYDDVQVGGFGLASVSLTRHVVRPDEAPGTAGPTPAATPR